LAASCSASEDFSGFPGKVEQVSARFTICQPFFGYPGHVKKRSSLANRCEETPVNWLYLFGSNERLQNHLWQREERKSLMQKSNQIKRPVHTEIEVRAYEIWEKKGSSGKFGSDAIREAGV
jgi:hypothetical protein